MNRYSVEIFKDNYKAIAQAHNTKYVMSAKSGDTSVGFNAAETLITALGVCLLTNINSLIPKMRLQIDDITLNLIGTREENPPRVSKIEIKLIIKTGESIAKLKKMVDLSLKYGTVTNTLKNNVLIDYEIVRKING